MTDNVAERVASNAVFLFVSQIITGALSLVTLVLLPRAYGAAGIGAYHLAASLWAIAALLIGFGTDVVITREIARNKDRLPELVSVGLFLRLIFHFAGFVAVVIFATLAGYASETVQIILVFGVANLVFQIGHIFSAALYGLEDIKVIAVASIVTEVAVALGVLIVIVAGQSIVVAASISVLAGFVRTLFLFWALRIRATLYFDLKLALIPWLLREGASILVNRLLRNLYVQADVIIISLFVNETVVGWYSVADVAFGALLTVPNIIGTALFPTMARLFAHEPERLPSVARRALNFVLLFSIPMGLGIVIVAYTLVLMIAGDEFVNSVPVLAGFGIVAIFTSINIFLSQLLIAMDMQKRLSVLLVIAIALTVPIDLILIPWTHKAWGNGALGGVIAYLLTEAVITVGAFWAMPKGMFTKQNAFYALRVMIAGCAMLLLTRPFRDVFVLIPVIIGILAYLLMAYILKLITREDIAFAKSMVQRGWLRIRGLGTTTPTSIQ